MSETEDEYTAYLTEGGVLQRLLKIFEQLLQTDPLPTDPLMFILHGLDCPLIPQSQMKSLERKVSRAHDELRYLRQMLINLGGEEYLYDSDSDEEQYVGAVGNVSGVGHSPDDMHYPISENSYESAGSLSSSEISPPPMPEFVVESEVGTVQNEAEEEAQVNEETPCCSRSMYGN